jgi:hypothetical protein
MSLVTRDSLHPETIALVGAPLAEDAWDCLRLRPRGHSRTQPRSPGTDARYTCEIGRTCSHGLAGAAQGSDSGPRTDDLVGLGERGPHLRGRSRLLTSLVGSCDECASRDQEPARDALLIHGEGPVSAAALAAAASGPQRRLSGKPLRCRQPLRHCWRPPSPSPLVAARTCAEMLHMPGTSLTPQTRKPGPL